MTLSFRAVARVLVLAVLCTALGACSGAAASPAQIEVSDARIPVPAGANGVAYMTLRNTGGSADRLLSIDTDVAESVDLHESMMQDGSMSMQPVEGIALPANGAAVLEPGGLHAMLLNVDGDLGEGDAVDLTLTFEASESQAVSAKVVPLVEE